MTNSIDQNISTRTFHSKNPAQPAAYFVDNNLQATTFTYGQIIKQTNKISNLLTQNSIQKGDRVVIFLPRTSDIVSIFFGILQTGALACPLFAAFQEQALIDRIQDCQAKAVFTNRDLLARIQKVAPNIPSLEKIFVVEELEVELQTISSDFQTVATSSGDPAFILYTSGSTGKPKGVVHSHGSFTHTYHSFKEVFDTKPNDILWCTADPGWITGISYTIIAPLAHGIPTTLFEGRFNPKNWYQILKQLNVSIFYTAPTALRMLRADDYQSIPENLPSLRVLGSVGEPLNTEVLEWAQEVFKVPVLDTWFQTELGAITIANTMHHTIKAGSMGKPLTDITADILDSHGKSCAPSQTGMLAIRKPHPSLMKTVWNNQKKYESYFQNDWYISGDTAYKDEEGYFHFIGRSDDIINTSGERVGPFEIEDCLVGHNDIDEAAVIGKPDDVKGERIKAFIVLSHNTKPSDELKELIKQYVKKTLGGHLYPHEIEFVNNLPKTKSGKIMRRVLKAKELGLETGDISTLED
jgi:acetyl-CoA synthetase